MQEDGAASPRCPRIAFSEEEILSFYKPWSKAIVVKVIERSFSFLTIKKRLEYLWAKAGRIQVSDMANSFFLVRFSENEDYQRATFGGPWKIAVNRIGNYIGRTVRIDLATEEGARGSYARVCLEVDLTKPLLGKYLIEDRQLLIEYESLGNICFSCELYGHKEDQCSINATKLPESNQPEPMQVEDLVTSGDAGSWMTVCRRNKKQTPKKVAPFGKAEALRSCFGVLSDLPSHLRRKRLLWLNPGPRLRNFPLHPRLML
ncbi:hypothetical protein LINPERPRIM_LOCUS37163 [Linum perenne]